MNFPTVQERDLHSAVGGQVVLQERSNGLLYLGVFGAAAIPVQSLPRPLGEAAPRTVRVDQRVLVIVPALLITGLKMRRAVNRCSSTAAVLPEVFISDE